MENNLALLLVMGAVVGGVAGYIGSFMVLKRMALVGDALSHVALPGMAVALVFHFSPIWGALLALSLAILGIWYLEQHSEVYPEALVGVFFTASLAVGVLITPQPDLLEALFGNIEKITQTDVLLILFASVLVAVLGLAIRKSLILGAVSEELAKSMKISVSRVNLIYLLLVGVVVALGIKSVGILLMGALVIVPAAAAKNVSRGLTSYFIYSVLFGIASAVAGILIADTLHIASGPAVVLTSIFIFVVTYLVKK